MCGREQEQKQQQNLRQQPRLRPKLASAHVWNGNPVACSNRQDERIVEMRVKRIQHKEQTFLSLLPEQYGLA